MKKNYLHAYAIVRYDAFHGGETAIDDKITIKKIVVDPDYAAAEVKRLNELNADKGAHYFWQITRIEQPFPMPGVPPRRPTAELDEAPQLDEAATAG